MIKKFSPLLVLIVLLVAATAVAADTEKSYILRFTNDPAAGTAFNPQFTIPLPEEVGVVNPPAGVVLTDATLYLTGPAEILPGTVWEIIITLTGPEKILSVLDNQEIDYGWRDDNFIGESRVIFAPLGQPNFIQQLRSNSQLVEQVKKVGVPLAIGLGGIGVISLGVTAVSTSASLAFNLAEFFRYLAFGFLRFKRRKPWGAVHNEVTHTPIAGALVKIFDAETQKLKDSQITDQDGRFGFLVQPGNYYIKTIRRGFAENQSDAFKVVESETMTGVNVPLLPETASIKRASVLLHAIGHFIEAINPYILALGTIFSIAIAVIVPSKLNTGVLIVYALVDVLKIALAIQTIKPFGLVKDQNSGRVLDLAVVRMFDAQKNWLLNTKVTGSDGKFDFLVTPGAYYLTAARDGYQPFHSKTIEIAKSGLINLDIKLTAER